MDSDFSRAIGRILGKSNPTEAERVSVVQALQIADTWSALPRTIQNLLNRLKREAARPPTLPGRQT